MNNAFDKLFCIMHLVNDSKRALTAKQISAQTGFNERTVNRNLHRLKNEKLIAVSPLNRGYSYHREGLKNEHN